MSKVHMQNIPCPDCGREQETAVWSSVNVTMDRELRSKLFSGEINSYKCESCGHEARLGVPLMYHDMDREYCVQYYPPGMIQDTSFLEQLRVDGGMDLSIVGDIYEPGTYLERPHVVFNMMEMTLYIEFRDRLFEVHGAGDRGNRDEA